jgi:hypothetical protein
MRTPAKTTFEQERQRAADGLDNLVLGRNARSPEQATESASAAGIADVTVFELTGALANRFRGRLGSIAENATTQAQRQRYGVGKWHEDFLFVERELIWPENSPGINLAKDVMKWIRGTLYGRIACSFCEKHSLSVPRVLIEWANQKMSKEEFAFNRDTIDRYSLAGLLLSPDLLPNRLVQVAGLVRWEEGVIPWQAIERKNNPDVIDGSKKAFESLVRTEPKNSRIMRFAPDSSECDPNPKSKLLHPALDGTFLYFRVDDATQPRHGKGATARQTQEEQWFYRETPGYFTSVYALYRATLNKNAKYEQEVAAISALAQTAQDINLRIAQDWKRDTPVELRQQMREELGQLIERASPVLAGVKHVAKQEAAKLLESIQQALAEAPHNPDVVVRKMQPLLWQLVAMRNRLAERGQDIPAKSRWNEVDQRNLQEYITKQEQAFKDLYDSLKKAPEIIKQHSKFFDGQTELSKDDSAREAELILKALNIRDGRLAVVTARPLLTFAKAMAAVMTELEGSVRNRERTGTEEAIVKLVILSKLEQANACIERLKRFTTYCDVKFDSFDKASSDLLTVLEKRDVFPNRAVPEYKAVYTPVQQRFSRMARRFSELRQDTLNDDERIVLYGRIRKYLDDPARDLETIVANLAGLELNPGGVSEDEGSDSETAQ